eukprot:3836844-Rhodomonas_salina.2
MDLVGWWWCCVGVGGGYRLGRMSGTCDHTGSSLKPLTGPAVISLLRPIDASMRRALTLMSSATNRFPLSPAINLAVRVVQSDLRSKAA